MKANIHPETKETTFVCACGETFKAKSSSENINVEVCHKCHPAYGDNINVVTKKSSNIEKFNRKYKLDEK